MEVVSRRASPPSSTVAPLVLRSSLVWREVLRRELQLQEHNAEVLKHKNSDALAEIQRVTSERDRARVDGISVRMDQMVKTDTQGTWM